MYRIRFAPGEPIGGFPLSGTLKVPFECTSDGTAFVNVVLRSSNYSPPVDFLVSVSQSGETHEFRLDQISELHDVMLKDHYASEAEVAFLVIAAREDKPGKEVFTTSDGEKHEATRNLAERRDYLVIFDRKGQYKKLVQMDESFALQRVAMFPSGAFLAYGFDTVDRSPRLAMLNEDGTLLKILEIPKGAAPASVFGPPTGNLRGPDVFIKPVQFVRAGDSIIVVQNKSDFPLLVVNPAGDVRALKPVLADRGQVNMLIPSDENLYALVGEGDGLIYELDPQNGSALRRIEVWDKSVGSVACVHEGKFLSFLPKSDKLVPLVGKAEPVVATH